MEEAEDARRRECQTTGQDQVGTTPFSHPHSIPWPQISCPSSLSLSVRDTSVAPQSHVCHQPSSTVSQQWHLNGRTYLYPSNHSGTRTLSAGLMIYCGLNLQKHFDLSFLSPAI